MPDAPKPHQTIRPASDPKPEDTGGRGHVTGNPAPPHGGGSATDEPVVGIDLGTAHSCVAVVQNGVARVILNQEGSPSTPSVVALTESGEWLVGEPARRQAVSNPGRTAFSFKRLMGRGGEEVAGADARLLPYRLDRRPGDPALVVLDGRAFYPAQLAARVLRKLKEAAEADLGRPVRRAVVTVPAYFNESQRQATLDAARIAGLDTEWEVRDPGTGKVRRMRMRLINEPTAAALTHRPRHDEVLAVVHMGGGTFDVSVLDAGDGVYTVKGVNGDVHLGGDAFDEALVNDLADRFLASHRVDLRGDAVALQRLREAAEQAKRDLSQSSRVDVRLPFMACGPEGPLHLEEPLSRPEYDRLTARLVGRCTGPIARALADAKLRPGDVQTVILVCGMMRLPSVRQAVRDAFGSGGVIKTLSDDAAALGAAIQGAAILRGGRSDIMLVDVNPITLGIETEGGRLSRLVERNTRIPTEKRQIISTTSDGQTEVVVRVFQGESELAASPSNRKLGEVRLGGLRPAPKGEPQIEVTLGLDMNGFLDVTARDRDTGRSETVRMFVSGGLSVARVEQLYREAEQERLIRAGFGIPSSR